MTKKKHGNGQSLIEVVVSLGIVVMLATGIIAATTTAVKSSQNTRARSEATKLAQEAMEVARSDRDNGWAAFESRDSAGGGSTTYCLASDLLFVQNSPANCANNMTVGAQLFTRYAEFEWDSGSTPPRMRVKVYVQWREGSATRQSFAESYFTQWR